MRSHRFSASLLLALTAPMIAVVAEARETGNIHGEGVDEGGLAVPTAPVTLSGRGVDLVPLALEHEAGLRAAAADGELWNLRITSVPRPEETRAYIETALAGRDTNARFAFAVRDQTTGTVLGSTSYHDILAGVKRVEITWERGSRA